MELLQNQPGYLFVQNEIILDQQYFIASLNDLLQQWF